MDTVDNGLYQDTIPARHSNLNAVLAGVAFAPIVGASAKRVRLEFHGDGAQIVILQPSPPNVAGFSIRLSTAYPVLVLEKDLHGSLVQSAWQVATAAATSNVTAVETVAD